MSPDSLWNVQRKGCVVSWCRAASRSASGLSHRLLGSASIPPQSPRLLVQWGVLLRSRSARCAPDLVLSHASPDPTDWVEPQAARAIDEGILRSSCSGLPESRRQ